MHTNVQGKRVVVFGVLRVRNRNVLALIARETGIAMATGSISAALKDPTVKDSFTIVRETNPTGKIFANLGTGQTLENAKKAIDLIQADALQIHVNSPQEIVMPEGDRDFSNWLIELEKIDIFD